MVTGGDQDRADDDGQCVRDEHGGRGRRRFAVVMARCSEHQVADELTGHQQTEEHAHIGGARDGGGQPADRRGEHGQQRHGRAGRCRAVCDAVRGHRERRGQQPAAMPRSRAAVVVGSAGTVRSDHAEAGHQIGVDAVELLADRVVGGAGDSPSACSRQRSPPPKGR